MTPNRACRAMITAAAFSLIALAAAACSSPPAQITLVAEDVDTPAPAGPTATTQDATANANAGLRVVLASTDLAVGPNRLAFGILDGTSSPVRVPEVDIALVYLGGTAPETRSDGTADFKVWPSGPGGVYATNVAFDEAGRWGLEVRATGNDGRVQIGKTGIVVSSQSASPGLGRPVPPSRNKTVRDVDDLREITTAADPDPDLYQMTIAEAVSEDLPTVITFATPAFCLTATCGPQVEVVSLIKDRYKGRANFIHVEVYDNPREMDGDISKGRLSPVLTEWGLVTEPFTFILDNDGLVAAKFEGFATEAELEAALLAVLSS